MTYSMTAPVDGARVRSLLEGFGWAPAQADENRFQLLLAESEPGVPDLALSITASGPLLQFAARRPVRYDAEHAAWTLSLVNAYHRSHCFPMGHVAWDAAGAPRFTVVGEVHLPVGQGASDDQLEGWVRGALGALDVFTGKVHRALAERALPGREDAPFDLEAWLEV